MLQSVDVDKIRSGNVPVDSKMIELLKMAYSGKLLARIAIIRTEAIKPFSSTYRPEIADEFRRYFLKQEKLGHPLPIVVYYDPVKDKFVMSDDYNAYFMFLERGYTKIPCYLIGESSSRFILEKSKPFRLQISTVEVFG